MSKLSIDNLHAIFKRIPMLSANQIKDFQIRRLPGHTNQNFHLKNRLNDWVLRIPKTETNFFINRKAEVYNADIALQLGLATECIWSDSSGLSLSKTLINTRSITSHDLQEEVVFESVISRIKILHQHKTELVGSVNLDKLLTRYFQLLPRSQQQEIDSEYRKAISLIKRLAQQDGLLVPSHNDLVLDNIMLGESRKIWIIDWEYSAMASPYWDLATLSNAANFDEKQLKSLLEVYRNQATDIDLDVLMDYRFVLKILSDCWMGAFTKMDAVQDQ